MAQERRQGIVLIVLFSPRSLYRLCLPGLLTAPAIALAQSTPRMLPVNTGTSLGFWQIANNAITFLAGAISAIAVTMFIIGAFFVTVSGVKEDYRQRGKDLMIGSILSLAVVAGAYSILRLVDFLLQ